MKFIKNFTKIEKSLNIFFKNKDLLIQAFTHRSYLNENPKFHLKHNERLEFLGDAVLELIITEYLYKNYPEKPEGELTNWRAALVNSKMLAKISYNLNFNDFILLSKGEAKEMNKARQYILANVFESFIGALYLDQGYNACFKFVKKYVIVKLSEVLEKELYKDAKSKFQEKAQREKGITPTYKVLEEWGPDHMKHFIIGVYLGKELIAKGDGLSKQEGEEMAAANALKIKNW